MLIEQIANVTIAIVLFFLTIVIVNYKGKVERDDMVFCSVVLGMAYIIGTIFGKL